MIDLDATGVLDLLRGLGVRYVWGAGSLAEVVAEPALWPGGCRAVEGGVGWDCSGWAQAALWRLGIVRPGAWSDVRAVDLANASDPVHPGEERLGDLAFYGRPIVSHVMVCLGGGMVVGASGGTSSTHGGDPRAVVACVSLAYRRDLITVGRLKAAYRRS